MQPGDFGRVWGGGQPQGNYLGGQNMAGAGSQSVPLLHQSYKNPNFAGNLLNSDNILDYFCDPANIFYDQSSCNQQVKMQNLNRPLNECLQSMNGIQYTLVGANPPLFVIMKQRRNSPTNVTPLCYYYIINGTVYQCPDLYTFVQSKLIGIVHPLRQALETARQFSRYNVAKGYYWQFKEDEKDKGDEVEEESPLTARSTFYQRTRTALIIHDLFKKYPLPEDVEVTYKGEDGVPTENGETNGISDQPVTAANGQKAERKEWDDREDGRTEGAGGSAADTHGPQATNVQPGRGMGIGSKDPNGLLSSLVNDSGITPTGHQPIKKE